MRFGTLTTLLVALTLTASRPAECRAQWTDAAVVGARQLATRAPVAPTGRLVFADTARAMTTQRPVWPYLVVGALAGAAIGGILAASYHDSFCDAPQPGYSCSSTSVGEGVVIGAGLGVMVGGFVWVVRRSSPGQRGLTSR